MKDTGDNSATDGVPAPNAVAISGRPEQIAKAREALGDLIPISVSVPVPFAMHRGLIGRGGADIRAFQDAHDVNLKVCSCFTQLGHVYLLSKNN